MKFEVCLKFLLRKSLEILNLLKLLWKLRMDQENSQNHHIFLNILENSENSLNLKKIQKYSEIFLEMLRIQETSKIPHILQ